MDHFAYPWKRVATWGLVSSFVIGSSFFHVDGTVKFTRGGRWNGKIQVTTPGGPAGGTFDIHVEERE